MSLAPPVTARERPTNIASQHVRPVTGQDMRHVLPIPSWDRYKPHQFALLVEVMERQSQKCPKCYGEGIVQKDDIVTINIPAGVGKGMQITVTGEGNAARRGGVNGDLIVVIDEKNHQELIREGNDLIYNLFISIPEAILGTNVEIPTVDSRVKIKIEPGTQPGKILRLRGKGLPDVNSYGRGDLLVNVNVWIPKISTARSPDSLKSSESRKVLNQSPIKTTRGFWQDERLF